MPIVGDVFVYRGSLVYRIVPATDTVPAVSETLPTLSMWLTENSPT